MSIKFSTTTVAYTCQGMKAELQRLRSSELRLASQVNKQGGHLCFTIFENKTGWKAKLSLRLSVLIIT